MVKNCSYIKAFTIIELMVSIFLTLVVVASFYKLYNMASRDERSAAIRISLHVTGERMLDEISNAIRFIGLNGKRSDWDFYNQSSAGSDDMPIIETAQQDYFSFLSPYGGPITKLAKDAEGTYPNCTFTLVSSAALGYDIKSFFLHNQDGIFETKENENFTVNINSNGELSFTTDAGFADNAPRDDLDGTECAAVFPSGTLVSGEDHLFTLKYNDSDRSLCLCSTYKKDKGIDCCSSTATDNDSIWRFINFKSDNQGQKQYYDMQRFNIQYLAETVEGNNIVAEWKNFASGLSDNDFRKDIVAVRFGFILVANRKRDTGIYTGTFANEYCIFGDERENVRSKDCYPLTDPNKIAYVFRRVVYIANHRLLKDFSN